MYTQGNNVKPVKSDFKIRYLLIKLEIKHWQEYI